MKGIKNIRSENQTRTSTSSKNSSAPSARKPTSQQLPVPCPAIRSSCVELLYRAQANFRFSRSTLFLAFSLLDRLLQRGLSLTEQTHEVVVGGLLLLCTKFNEVYPLTVRKLNLLAQGEFSLQQYAEAEAAMLQALDFTILLDPTYEQLCVLETVFQGRTAELVREQIKLVVLNPNETLIYGAASIITAITQSATQTDLAERSSNNSSQSSEACILRMQLQRLSSTQTLIGGVRC